MITKPLDRVNEAYNGDLGDAFSEKTRGRVNWIVNNTSGKKILDIGCSQGIIPIILGREGKVIDALDIAEESIEFAKNALNNEHESVRENVKFKVSNFMKDEELDKEYETILLTEVLEHISDTQSFLEKVYNYLSDNGTFIVTVPFGINDYFDHKRTYYFLDLYDQLNQYFVLEKIEYLGKWTGVVCSKRQTPCLEKSKMFSREELGKLEKGFYEIERELINKFNDLHKIIKEKNLVIQDLRNKIEQPKSIVLQHDDSLKNLNENLQYAIKQIDTDMNSKDTLLHNNQVLLAAIQQEAETVRKELLKSLENEKSAIQTLLDKEKELNNYKSIYNELEQKNRTLQKKNTQFEKVQSELEKSYENLRKKNNNIIINNQKLEDKLAGLEKKYNSLKTSKLGSVTVKYWEWRRRLKKNKE